MENTIRMRNILLHKTISILYCLALVLSSCEGVDEVFTTPEGEVQNCTNSVISSGKYYEKNDKQYLYGGKDSTTHFEITDWSLSRCNLGNGLGREFFEALNKPSYGSLLQSENQYPDDAEAVLLITESAVKVFPLSLLNEHELVNEVADGNPVMVVFCPLADLVSVYSRSYCGATLTFAVSGFTYKEAQNEETGPKSNYALESFILWDRETESLWWPILDKGVAGFFQGIDLTKYQSSKWGRATIGEIRQRYPNAVVLREGQSFNEQDYIPNQLSCLSD